jgi:hypothetical protein
MKKSIASRAKEGQLLYIWSAQLFALIKESTTFIFFLCFFREFYLEPKVSEKSQIPARFPFVPDLVSLCKLWKTVSHF